MDTKKVFRMISDKLMKDFVLSAEVNHNGNKGSYRESALKDFLVKGRLPERYGIGSGEIVGPIQNVSKQSDLIIYDKINGFSLIYSEQIQVYPIECVVGIIEVKSSLNKAEFIKALDNIKSVKSLVPKEMITKEIGGGMKMSYKRPSPFSAVFAYQLDGNSLESLEKNLRDWEKDVPKELWPNVIAILNEGMIFHYTEGLREVYSNEDLLKAYSPGYVQYTNDTLFKFYTSIIDLCAATNLGPVQLHRYLDPAEQVGPFVVSNHNRLTRSGEDAIYKLTENFIKKIVDTCRLGSGMTHGELLYKRLGATPEGMLPEDLAYKVYFYNPDNLKGIHEVDNPVTIIDGKYYAMQGITEPCHYIVVDNITYYIPQVYITEKDVEKIPGKKLEDL